MSAATCPSPISAERSAAPLPRVPASRIFAFVFLALAVTLTFTCRETFFSTPYYEEGDDAANALQIERAKEFRELHGNYSRWRFHHPGPAFFYAYAAGEWLLHDVAKIAPAPRNAHLYTGTLLQLAFYAGAVALLARYSRQPLLTAALALVAAALHFTRIERDHFIYTVWPPDVLLMPFLCFIVAAAAVSLRNRSALPVLVVSGSFLVHGHIAQPLFVVPITLLALTLAWRTKWLRELRGLGRDRAGRCALLLLALFLLPLGLDLLAGKESNAHDILRHLRFHRDAGQTLWQSALCYLSYFISWDDQTIFNELSAASYTPFRERASQLFVWVGLLAVATVSLRRKQNPAADETENGVQFRRRLLGFWIVGTVLTLVWGIRQDGGFTTFNSDFNFSLVHVIALVAILGLVEVLPRVSRGLARFALVAAVPVFALALPVEFPVENRGNEVALRVHGLLRKDPKPAAPKLITWDLAVEDWYEAVTLARALQRLGIEFYVHSSWGFMFGRDKILNNTTDPLGRGALSLWHVKQRPLAPPGASLLNSYYSVLFGNSVPQESLPVRLDFWRNEHVQHRLLGIGRGESDGAWTEGNTAAVFFNIPTISQDIELVLDATGFVTKRTSTGQRLNLRVNGELIGHHRFDTQRQRARFVVPGHLWNRQSPQVVVFDMPDAISPAEVNLSADQRMFGLKLYALALEPLPR